MNKNFLDALTKKVGDLIASEIDKNEMYDAIGVSESDVLKVINLINNTDNELATKIYQWYKSHKSSLFGSNKSATVDTISVTEFFEKKEKPKKTTTSSSYVSYSGGCGSSSYSSRSSC